MSDPISVKDEAPELFADNRRLTMEITALRSERQRSEARIKELEEALREIMDRPIKAVLPWTHEAAADEYMRMRQADKLLANSLLNRSPAARGEATGDGSE